MAFPKSCETIMNLFAYYLHFQAVAATQHSNLFTVLQRILKSHLNLSILVHFVVKSETAITKYPAVFTLGS